MRYAVLKQFTMPTSVKTSLDGRSSRTDRLVGWSSQDLSDDDLLTRDIDLIDGLYRSLEE
jgi:hypothetical protein